MQVPVVRGDKLLTRLWDTIADQGIGSLLQPWSVIREDQAALDVRREQLHKLEELLRAQHRTIRPEAHSSTGAAGDYVQPGVEAIAMRNLQAQAIRQEIALASAVAHAEQALAQDDSEPSGTPVSGNWLLRWREYASNVATEELHTIWGRVLAAEVKAPGQFPLRSLDFVKHLTPEEIRAIDKLSPFAVENFILQDPKGLDAAGVSTEVLGEMQNIGLLTGVQQGGMSAKIRTMSNERFYCALRCAGSTMLAVNADDATKICALKVYFLSGIGRHIMNLCTSKPNEEMLARLTAEIKEQGFKVQRGKFKLVRPGTAEFYDLADV
jgi:hypothetical protein